MAQIAREKGLLTRYAGYSVARRLSIGALIGVLLFGGLALGLRSVGPSEAQPGSAPGSFNPNCTFSGNNNNNNCNQFNLGPAQRRISQLDASTIASALLASKVKGSVVVQTDIMACSDCDSFASQLAAILQSVPGWTVKSIRNGITMTPYRGVALGVKDKTAPPESAKAIVAAFQAIPGASLQLFDANPPDGFDSVLQIFQPIQPTQ
jgi:hypothetical protein